MENAGGVGGRQGVCDLHRVVQRLAELQPALPHHLRQRGTGKYSMAMKSTPCSWPTS